LVHWPSMGGLLHLVQHRLPQRGLGGLRPRPVPSSLYQLLTAHPSTASVPTSYHSMWHYNCFCALRGQRWEAQVHTADFQIFTRPAYYPLEGSACHGVTLWVGLCLPVCSDYLHVFRSCRSVANCFKLFNRCTIPGARFVVVTRTAEFFIRSYVYSVSTKTKPTIISIESSNRSWTL